MIGCLLEISQFSTTVKNHVTTHFNKGNKAPYSSISIMA